MEERRLFYVACTRARQRLVVTAVASAPTTTASSPPGSSTSSASPSRRSSAARPGRCRWPGWSPSCAARVADPETTEPLREAAARRLARLAGETVGQRRLVPSADPSTWWGTRAASRSVQPVRDPDQPVPVSASVLESMMRLPDPVVPRARGRRGRPRPPVRQPRRDGARARPAGRQRRARRRPRRRRPADGPRRRGLGPPRLPHARGPRPASTSGSAPPWPGSSPGTTTTARTLLGDRGAVLHRRRAARRRGGQAHRLRRPPRARRRRQASWWSTSRPARRAPSNKAVEAPRPARPLPVRRRPRRRRRPLSRRAAEAGGAELVQLGLLDGGPAAVVQPQPVQAEDGPAREGLRARARPHRRAAPLGDVPRGRRRPLPRLLLRADLPDQERRTGDLPVIAIRTPEDLQAVMKTAYAPSDAAVGGDLRAAHPRRRDRGRRLGQDHADGGPGRLPRRHRPGPPRRGARPDLHHQGRQRAAGPDPHGAARPPARSTSPPGRRGRPRADGGDLQRVRRRAAHRPRPAHRPRARHPGDHRRRALPARRPGGRPVHRRGPAPHRPPRDRHPEPPRPRQRDERAPRPARRRAPRSTPRRGPVRGRARGRGAGQEPQDLPRAGREGRLRDRPARRAARPRRGLPPAQARPRADGLLRPDRARRPARQRPAGRRRERAVEVQGGPPRRVPRHLGRPGRDALPALLGAGRRAWPRARGHRGRRPQPGHLRLARRLGVQHPQLRGHVPGGDRRGPDPPAHRQPPLRPADPRGRQPAGRAALRQVRPGRPPGRRRAGRRRRRHGPGLRDARRRAGVAGRGRAGRPRRAAGPRSAS